MKKISKAMQQMQEEKARNEKYLAAADNPAMLSQFARYASLQGDESYARELLEDYILGELQEKDTQERADMMSEVGFGEDWLADRVV